MDERKKVIIYDTGEIFWWYEDEIYDPPEPPEKEARENYKGYNEKETE